jgi:xanthine dehydrogenase molybdenum-binding subunit
MAETIRFSIDGKDSEFAGDPNLSLLDYLRDHAGITTAKDGCAPQAACGCCTVLLDGKAVLSCVTKMSKAAGKAVTTTAGLEKRVADAFATAFSEKGGAQCGFCIPGIVMRAAAFLKTNPSPSRDEIAKSLNQHLCRCTGYTKIIDSIEAVGASMRAGTPVPVEDQTGKVGSRLPKVGITEAVLGNRPYVADLERPGMLHAAVRLSGVPRARVLKIDASKAEALEGVERVLLAKDVPGQRTVGLIVRDWPQFIAEGEIAPYVGSVLAVVVARSRALAREAASMIEVGLDELEPVTDMFEALKEGSPKVHENGNKLSVSVAKKGDAEAAFADCDFVHEGTYETQFIEHAYLEPEACLAEPDEDGVLVHSQGQGVYEDRRQIAELLGLAEEKVKVVLVPNGGGFGGKEDLLVQGHAALAAKLLGKPVKLQLTREESLLMSPKRHPLHMEYKLGCTKEGKLLALHARIHGDTGAHASVGMKVLERAAGHGTGAYAVPNVDLEATAVYTNNIPCGAMRGFGANQATFAMECAVDELCAQGGFDRWQFRWDNALVEGLTTSTGQKLASGVGVRASLEAVKEKFQNAKYAGIGCGLKNTGIGNGMPDEGTTKIRVLSADEIEICHGWTEMGQGVDTMAVQTFCEETGLPPSLVRVRTRTADEAPAGMTTASRATSIVGNSTIAAARTFKKALDAEGLGALVGRTFEGSWRCDWTNKPGKDTGGKPVCTHYSYSYAAQVAILGDDGRVEELVAAHDAGKVMNPMLFEGQIEGSLHMGLGYAVSEDFPMENARPKSLKFRDLGVLRARETPKLTAIGVEVADEFGPYGAKGVGEIGLVPTAGAVANAFFAYDGQRRRKLPMKPPSPKA